MTYDFQDRVFLITGAASGIGRATALKLSSLAASLALCDINATSLITTTSLCTGSHFTHSFDIASSSDCTQFIKDTISRYGKIDGIFNCAGINPTPISLEDTTDEYWDILVNTNLKGTYNVTRAAIPFLKSGSSFVNVSSICGLHPFPTFSIYCATKYAIIGFSKSMALELGPKGIRVNVLAPGSIDTPTNSGVVMGEEGVKSLEAKVSLGRLGSVEECADVVAFLFSDGARYMNGSVVEVHGGTAES
ncbi:hypothetical protein JAAARDRAFT_164149 [Jaapia argillacea MUCL 33604]|uniref:NAD(P)-binding protein n=1 Tax=Jaapia argillacea MUCL 33604 TaxID=933084 RepID=A0A067P8I3_9AGAM|nr:hypothetical protein JAAARDRAFT_164149 [Jaapia argillacea MUCL 33604]